MIFGSLIRRAEDAVENIVDQALARVLIAVPLIIAAGFATAAGSNYLNARYGPELGNLLMAAVFVVLGLGVAGYVALKSKKTGDASEDAQQTGAPEAIGEPASGASAPLSSSERELMNSVFASAAPVAIPGLVRMLLRNIPLVLALIAAVYILTRNAEGAQSAEAAGGSS